MSTPDLSPFVTSLTFVMAHEGGYADHAADPGGATNYGITHGTYSAWFAQRGLPAPSRTVKDIRMDEVVSIYWQNYWLDGKCDRVAEACPSLALPHFDCGVNMGLVRAAKCLQHAVGARADGVIGPVTLAACGVADPKRAVTAYLEERAEAYREIARNRPTSTVFLAGWLARLRWVARATGTPITQSFAGAK